MTKWDRPAESNRKESNLVLKKWKLALMSTTLSLIAAFVWVVPAFAGSTGQFVSEGCTGSGDNYVSGSNLHIRTTAWLSSNGNVACSYDFVQGWYYNSSAVWTLAGPGWDVPNSGLSLDYPGPTGFTEIGVNPAGHSMCWAGGPCGSAVFRNSYYP